MPGMPKALPSTTLAVLRPTPGRVDQVVEPARHLAVVPLDEGGAQLEQRLGLGAEEPERADDPLERLAVGGRHRARVRVGREQRRADRVDPLVGGLRAEHGDDEQLEGVVEVELAASRRGRSRRAPGRSCVHDGPGRCGSRSRAGAARGKCTARRADDSVLRRGGQDAAEQVDDADRADQRRVSCRCRRATATSGRAVGGHDRRDLQHRVVGVRDRQRRPVLRASGRAPCARRARRTAGRRTPRRAPGPASGRPARSVGIIIRRTCEPGSTAIGWSFSSTTISPGRLCSVSSRAAVRPSVVHPARWGRARRARGPARSS